MRSLALHRTAEPQEALWHYHDDMCPNRVKNVRYFCFRLRIERLQLLKPSSHCVDNGNFVTFDVWKPAFGATIPICEVNIGRHQNIGTTQWMQGSSQLGSMVSGHCTILLDCIITMGTSCFDNDFVSQMKLTTLPLIHCFVYAVIVSMWRRSSYDDDVDGGILVVGGDPGVDEDRRVIQASHSGEYLDQVPRPSVPRSSHHRPPA